MQGPGGLEGGRTFRRSASRRRQWLVHPHARGDDHSVRWQRSPPLSNGEAVPEGSRQRPARRPAPGRKRILRGQEATCPEVGLSCEGSPLPSSRTRQLHSSGAGPCPATGRPPRSPPRFGPERPPAEAVGSVIAVTAFWRLSTRKVSGCEPGGDRESHYAMFYAATAALLGRGVNGPFGQELVKSGEFTPEDQGSRDLLRRRRRGRPAPR